MTDDVPPAQQCLMCDAPAVDPTESTPLCASHLADATRTRTGGEEWCRAHSVDAAEASVARVASDTDTDGDAGETNGGELA